MTGVIGKYVASEASYVKPGELPALENKNSIQRLIKHLKIRVTPNDKCDWKYIFASEASSVKPG